MGDGTTSGDGLSAELVAPSASVRVSKYMTNSGRSVDAMVFFVCLSVCVSVKD